MKLLEQNFDKKNRNFKKLYCNSKEKENHSKKKIN